MNKAFLLFSIGTLGVIAQISISEAASVKGVIPGKSSTTKSLPTPKSLIGKSPAAKTPPKLQPVAPVRPNPVHHDTYAKTLHLQNSSGNWTMNSGQKAALDKLLTQETLTAGERQQLSDLLFSGQQAGLSREDETALSYLLLDETARNASAGSAPTATADPAGPMFLRIYNNTGERLKVWLQVLPEVEECKQGDLQEEKADKKSVPQFETLVYALEPGKAYDLEHNGQRVKASMIRVWAIGPTRSWAQHRDHELLLTNPGGKSKTYTLTFAK